MTSNSEPATADVRTEESFGVGSMLGLRGTSFANGRREMSQMWRFRSQRHVNRIHTAVSIVVHFDRRRPICCGGLSDAGKTPKNGGRAGGSADFHGTQCTVGCCCQSGRLVVVPIGGSSVLADSGLFCPGSCMGRRLRTSGLAYTPPIWHAWPGRIHSFAKRNRCLARFRCRFRHESDFVRHRSRSTPRGSRLLGYSLGDRARHHASCRGSFDRRWAGQGT